MNKAKLASLFAALSFSANAAGEAISTTDHFLAMNSRQDYDPARHGHGHRAVLLPQRIDINGKGPHYLKAYVQGMYPFTDTCIIFIDAVDRKTGKETPLLESSVSLFGLSPSAVEGKNYPRSLDTVEYNFKIDKCSLRSVNLKITQDLTNLPEYRSQKPKIQARGDQDYASSIRSRFSGADNETLIESESITVDSGAPLQFGIELHTSREIAFERGADFGGSGGLNVGVFQASLKKSILESFEEKTGWARTKTRNVFLDPTVCKNWTVNTYETSRVGYFSAPDLGITKEYRFSVPVSQRLEVVNECVQKKKSATSESGDVLGDFMRDRGILSADL